MGFWKVIAKSALKGLKTAGLVAGSGAVTAVLTDPGVIAGLAAAAGPLAPAAVLGITFALRTVLDALKHKDKM